MLPLYLAGVQQAFVVVQDGFREACGAGGEVDCRIIRQIQGQIRGSTGAVGNQPVVVLRKGGTVFPNVEQQAFFADLRGNFLHSADKFRAEYQNIHLRKIHTVLDLVRSIAEVQGYRQGTGLENAEINGQPLQAVHQQDRHLVALLDAPGQQEIGKPICLFVEHAPGDLPPVVGHRCRLDQLVLLPGYPMDFLDIRVDLHQSCVLSVQDGVAFQYICNGHNDPSFLVAL